MDTQYSQPGGKDGGERHEASVSDLIFTGEASFHDPF